MTFKFLCVIILFTLTGCIGSYISSHPGGFGEEFPDIRTVPERKDASLSRGLHRQVEEASRTADLKKLEKDRQEIKERDKALRERTFSQPNNPNR